MIVTIYCGHRNHGRDGLITNVVQVLDGEEETFIANIEQGVIRDPDDKCLHHGYDMLFAEHGDARVERTEMALKEYWG